MYIDWYKPVNKLARVKKPPMSRNVKAPITHRPFVSTPTDIPAEQIINAKNGLKQPITPLSNVLRKSRGVDPLTDSKLVSLSKAKSGNDATISGIQKIKTKRVM